MRVTDTHVYFWGSFLSNFWWCDFDLMFGEDKFHFNTSEQAFMAMKAIQFRDYDSLKTILDTPDGKSVKILGRKVKNFDEDEWNSVSEHCMYLACTGKFQQNENLSKALLDTHNKILVEASPVDRIWGVGLAENDDTILDSKNWRGENRLGNVLMRVRTDLLYKDYNKDN